MRKSRLLIAAFASVIVFISGAATASSASVGMQRASYVPTDDAQVIAQLPLRMHSGLAPTVQQAPERAMAQAKALIEQSRREADPRSLGQAQALLQQLPLGRRQSLDAIVLSATIAQSLHRFDEARQMLNQGLAQPTSASPNQPAMARAQALLLLASIERVTGHYPASLQACKQLAHTASARIYAAACLAETHSLQGKHSEARATFAALLSTSAHDKALAAWLLSLSAENEERAGNDKAAQAAYEQSLSLQADRYTAIAYADFLIRTAQPALAIAGLSHEPQTDTVLLRRAYALRKLQKPEWLKLRDELAARMRTAQAREADGSFDGHAREAAQFYLWLADDSARAMALAQQNWQKQREPADALLLVDSARRTGVAELQSASRQVAALGLVDARIELPAAR
jgi:hypothetical protein